jgi:hypothetical protein
MEVGLTETSVISVNDLRNKGFRVGTVGKVLILLK